MTDESLYLKHMFRNSPWGYWCGDPPNCSAHFSLFTVPFRSVFWHLASSFDVNFAYRLHSFETQTRNKPNCSWGSMKKSDREGGTGTGFTRWGSEILFHTFLPATKEMGIFHSPPSPPFTMSCRPWQVSSAALVSLTFDFILIIAKYVSDVDLFSDVPHHVSSCPGDASTSVFMGTWNITCSKLLTIYSFD